MYSKEGGATGMASATTDSNVRVRTLQYPVIDLSWERGPASALLVRACEEFGFFKVINHGVSRKAIARMEAESRRFFSLASRPLGYGIRNIGFQGDMGELEYLLLHSNPSFISEKAMTICSKDPVNFSVVVNEYVKQVRQLACELLEMLGEGLGLEDSGVFSRLLEDSESDSLLRLNHYPVCLGREPTSIDDLAPTRNDDKTDVDDKCKGSRNQQRERIGFGEHSDPQILSILWSNHVNGLQILSPSSSSSTAVGGGGSNSNVWFPVPADPAAFFVNVGDLLQVMTNGRLHSVRHRAMANPCRSRLSIIFFGAPPLHARISPLPQLVEPHSTRRYRSFTWAEFKKTMYSLRLGHNRLDLFQADPDGEDSN